MGYNKNCDDPCKAGWCVDVDKVSIPAFLDVEENKFKYKINILQLNQDIFKLLDFMI